MSVRFFGEFLVQRGSIKPEDLAAALIEQMQEQPSPSKLVFENNLLPVSQLLDVFHLQQVDGIDFLAALHKMNLLSPEILDKIEEHQSKARKPIGELLVKRGAIDLKNITKMLDEFLAQAEVATKEVKITSTPVNPISEPVLTASAAPEVESVEVEAVSEATPEEELYQPGIIAELEDMFDERKRRAVKVAMSFIKDKNPPDSSVISKLMNDTVKIVRTVLGLVKIFGIIKLGDLMQEVERVLNLRADASQCSREVLQVAATIIGNAMEEAWTMRESISKNCTENVYFSNAANKERYETILAQLREIK